MSHHSSAGPLSDRALPDPGTSSSGRARWWLLALVCVAQLMLILDVTVVNVALPTIDRDLGRGGALGWVIAAYSVTFGLLLIAGGILGDRIGLRLAFLIGLLVFTAASLGASAATTPASLIVFRVAQGIGAAVLSPAALGLVLATFTGRDRTKALAVWAGIGGAGSAIGAVLGGVLTQAGGWRMVFLVNVPVGVIVGVLMMITAYRAVPSMARNAARVTVRRPAATARALSTRTVSSGAITLVLASLLLVGSFFALTISLQDAAGLDPLAAGLAFLPAAIAVVIGAQLGAHLLGRMPARTVGGAAFVIVVAGFGTAWLVPHSVPAMIAGVAVAAFGLGPALVTATATATSEVSPGDSGAASGLVNTVHEVGGGLGVLLASVPAFMSLTASGSTLIFGAAAGCAVVAGAIAALVLPRRPLAASGGFHH
ncbi:MFS transporter [Rathayibacter sp. KR2-224]|uniref:MFS transporter n=1 Tax=Rathayibacter sp. KR2-224 TaxID=3400913 RepID=UPI003C0C508B